MNRKKKTPKSNEFQVPKIVWCRWLDAQHPMSTWQEEHLPGPLGCESCGFLVYEDADRVVISAAVAYQEETKPTFTAEIVIPKVCIQEIRELTRT